MPEKQARPMIHPVRCQKCGLAMMNPLDYSAGPCGLDGGWHDPVLIPDAAPVPLTVAPRCGVLAVDWSGICRLDFDNYGSFDRPEGPVDADGIPATSRTSVILHVKVRSNTEDRERVESCVLGALERFHAPDGASIMLVRGGASLPGFGLSNSCQGELHADGSFWLIVEAPGTKSGYIGGGR